MTAQRPGKANNQIMRCCFIPPPFGNPELQRSCENSPCLFELSIRGLNVTFGTKSHGCFLGANLNLLHGHGVLLHAGRLVCARRADLEISLLSNPTGVADFGH